MYEALMRRSVAFMQASGAAEMVAGSAPVSATTVDMPLSCSSCVAPVAVLLLCSAGIVARQRPRRARGRWQGAAQVPGLAPGPRLALGRGAKAVIGQRLHGQRVSYVTEHKAYGVQRRCALPRARSVARARSKSCVNNKQRRSHIRPRNGDTTCAM